MVTSSRPAQAASATAARAVTRSARSPSTSNAAHTVVISRSASSPRVTRRQPLPGLHDVLGERRLVGGEPQRERLRVGLVREPTPDDLGPLGRLAGGPYLDGQAEPVEQLRAQLALLGVHGADQQEPRGVAYGDPLALDVRRTQGRGVEQQVDQVVVQQVDLVDVEHPAVGGGEQAGLERLDPLGQRPLEVERAGDPVLGGADRQLDEPGRAHRRADVRLVRAVGALRVRLVGGAGEPAAGDDLDLGQQAGQGAHDGRLGGALLAPYENSPDGGRDGVDEQREPEVVETDHGGERVRRHAASLPRGVRAPGRTDDGAVSGSRGR